PDSLRTAQGLGDLLIETPRGWIPARQIADIRETEGPNQILRENGRRRIVVLANSDGTTDMAAIVAAIRQSLRDTRLPEGMFAILYSRYRSAIRALIIMGSVPLALIGSVAALWLAGQPLSVASMIGFITLTGIASRNGILKISHIINLALNEDTPFGRDLITRGCLERMTPVLMTALAAGVALIPLLIDPASFGKEILYPVAVTVFGGVISATLLDAFVTPLLMLWLGRKPIERLIAATAETQMDPAPEAKPMQSF